MCRNRAARHRHVAADEYRFVRSWHVVMERWVASSVRVADSAVADPPVRTLSPNTVLLDTDTWQLSNVSLR